MKHTACITWASRGIWLELAHLHAQAGHNVVLVARSSKDLEALAKKLTSTYNIQAHICVCDLTQDNGPEQVYTFCKEHNLHIDYLINNAWFGGYGAFAERSWEDDHGMINLNIVALTQLTHLFLPDMLEKKSWHILQVASTAGMVPGPFQAVYHATKAYVLSLSQAIAKEIEDTWVTMTALCPGPVATGFAKAANLEDTEIFQQAAPASDVAKDGFDAMLQWKLVVISWLPTYYKLLLSVLPLLPRKVVLNEAAKAIQKKN